MHKIKPQIQPTVSHCLPAVAMNLRTISIYQYSFRWDDYGLGRAANMYRLSPKPSHPFVNWAENVNTTPTRKIGRPGTPKPFNRLASGSGGWSRSNSWGRVKEVCRIILMEMEVF
eukprot:TRINITY_DN42476_c2_g1_i3.p1 TRINITY_DN42476_c2_g1~~TRINITY_DN42476_c2_g1_i3.p1  ORF type:complete len:115 (-),score=5.39 TRINITY_DN42476_c2_g1_i3:143-487(-)